MAMPGTPSPVEPPDRRCAAVEELETVVIRFAGDSGDGIQLVGDEFSRAVAVAAASSEARPGAAIGPGGRPRLR